MRIFETLDPSVQEDLVAASDLAFTTAIYRYPAIQKTGRDDATLEDVLAGLRTAADLLKKPSLTLYAQTLRAATLKKAA